jgi:hypothetical protein
MLRFPVLATILGIVVGCDTDHGTAPNAATVPAAELGATNTKTRSVTPLTVSLMNTCYNPPVGETVRLSGNLVRSLFFVDTPNVESGVDRFRFEGVTGVGLTSGIRYRLHSIGSLRGTFFLPAEKAFAANEIRILRLIGQGPGSNMLVTFKFRVVVDDFGLVLFIRLKDTVRCQRNS